MHPKVGLVIYPASRVDWRAYAPVAAAIARAGFLVVVVAMPLNLASLDVARAQSVMKKFTRIPRLGHARARGGRSHGRSIRRASPACRTGPHPLGRASGGGNNLASSPRISAMSISAERDGLVPQLVVRESAWLLPATTRWVTIVGGNHSQFGWYGDQARDGKALISRAEQQARVVRATVDMLRSIAM